MDINQEANRILEQYRDESEKRLRHNERTVQKACPGFSELKKEYNRKGLAFLSSNVHPQSAQEKEKLQLELEDLKEQMNQLLKEHGFADDFLTRQYHCDKCHDTGAYNGKICECKRAIMIGLNYRESEIEEKVRFENFEKFDFNVFRAKKKESEYISPRELMTAVYQMTKQYATQFHSTSKSLLLVGQVGVGKTFLMSSIAKEVLDQGFSVIYQSAPALMKLLFDYYFAPFETRKEAESRYEMLRNVDLLMIDDLGSESVNGTSISHLFELLNDRIQRNRPMVISTNLSTEEIKEFYDLRIYSRIKGHFELLKIIGDDLRLRGKE